MNFESKIWVLPNPQIDDTEAVCFVNIVPEVIPKPITETKVEPIRKKLLAINFTSINDNSQLVVNPEDIITEQLEVPSLNLSPEDLNVYELEEPIDKIFSIVGVEQVPIYPGCEDLYTNAERRGCMSEKIARLIQRKFNTDLASILGLNGKQKILVQFKINKSGNVTEIKARALHTKLEKETIRVIDKIPQLIPGKQRGQNVEVSYSLPIIIQVEY